MSQPLVSVICLCYNHQQYVLRAIESVLRQTYKNVELIVVDDASTDESAQLIDKASKLHGFYKILNNTNLGNCRSFNSAFAISKGKYIIDLAADDTLMPDRVAIGVAHLEQKDNSYGVHFCDVNLIDEYGAIKGTHFQRDAKGNLQESIPDGDLYETLVEKYFICTPSMMIRREVLEELDGYDENLSYEDFDFWVRSSRKFKYVFSNHILVQRTILSDSLSADQLRKKNIHIMSTAKVCEKILKMNTSEKENTALLERINYELKWALVTENWEAAKLFIDIKDHLSVATIRSRTEKLIQKIKPPWFPLWKMILKLNH